MSQVFVAAERYQLHVMLLDVGPAPWRRFLIRPETTIDKLHRLIQRCMEWDDQTWHSFRIHGTVQFGRRRGYSGSDQSGTADMALSRFCVIPGERFCYDYGSWRCQLRLEKIVVVHQPRFWPVCIAGKWSAPPEACGDGRSYMTHRERIRCPTETIDLCVDLVDDGPEDPARFREQLKKIIAWSRWMHFDRRQLNTNLRSLPLAWEEEKDDAFSFAIGG